MIDLRSDTVTVPGPDMRAAIASAEVGDDVFGEDPTVTELQTRVARLLGKEAALFVPSGVMGNQLALRAHTSPGDEVILDAGSHIANYESGAAAALSGVQLRQVTSSAGHPEPDVIRASIRTGYYWEPKPSLICLENTHSQAGGTVFPMDKIVAISEIAKEHSLGLHLDGARLWNASAATGISEAEYAIHFDSVNVCLSKGLGAPVGSILAGTEVFIRKAHRFRKMYGGGMRQAGILAAAGLYGVEHHRSDLVRDHELARVLARSISESAAFSVDLDRVQTNIVMFDVVDGRTAKVILGSFESMGILMVPFGPYKIRATTHRDISAADMETVVERIKASF